jgi:hypothetical protein
VIRTSESGHWRGIRVMNVGVVSEAYAIASNYLRRSGAISPHMATDDQLLEIIVRMFERGEFNKIRLANWCPGSVIRIISRRVRLRMSEPKGHQQISDSSVVLDLTFRFEDSRR